MRLTGFSDVGLRILIRLAAEDGVQRISTRQIAEAYGYRDEGGVLPKGAPDPRTHYPLNR